MDIEKLAAQNPWWANKEAIRNDDKIKRVIEAGEKIRPTLKSENQILIGPRQLGKTTALKYDIYKKILKQNMNPAAIMYYSFDTARNFEEISDVIDTFTTGQGKKFVYLDEVSFVEGWQRAIKQFLDSAKIENVTVYVTGSSSINLKKELMPGRKIKFWEFMPLSFREFLMSFGSENLKRYLEKNQVRNLEDAIKKAPGTFEHSEEISRWFSTYIITGGYPDAIFDYINNGRISDELYDVHWNAFISDVSKNDKSIEIAIAVVYGLLESYSSKVNLSKIALMQGIKSHVTVREYLEDFDSLFVSKSIFPVSGKKYIFRKERKVYFNDPFLYNVFAKKINVIDKAKESKIIEGIVFNHLYRFINMDKTIAEPKTAVCFYSGKHEVDFVLNDFGFEVKWQNQVGHADFPSVTLKNKIILSKKTLNVHDNGDVKIIPLPLFLSIL